MLLVVLGLVVVLVALCFLGFVCLVGRVVGCFFLQSFMLVFGPMTCGIAVVVVVVVVGVVVVVVVEVFYGIQ